VAACHYPLTDEEVATRLPAALTHQRVRAGAEPSLPAAETQA
jgi:hypothetical protein